VKSADFGAADIIKLDTHTHVQFTSVMVLNTKYCWWLRSIAHWGLCN